MTSRAVHCPVVHSYRSRAQTTSRAVQPQQSSRPAAAVEPSSRGSRAVQTRPGAESCPAVAGPLSRPCPWEPGQTCEAPVSPVVGQETTSGFSFCPAPLFRRASVVIGRRSSRVGVAARSVWEDQQAAAAAGPGQAGRSVRRRCVPPGAGSLGTTRGRWEPLANRARAACRALLGDGRAGNCGDRRAPVGVALSPDWCHSSRKPDLLHTNTKTASTRPDQARSRTSSAAAFSPSAPTNCRGRKTPPCGNPCAVRVSTRGARYQRPPAGPGAARSPVGRGGCRYDRRADNGPDCGGRVWPNLIIPTGRGASSAAGAAAAAAAQHRG